MKAKLYKESKEMKDKYNKSIKITFKDKKEVTYGLMKRYYFHFNFLVLERRISNKIINNIVPLADIAYVEEVQEEK